MLVLNWQVIPTAVKAARKMQSSNGKSTMDFSDVTAWESEKLTETEATVQLG